MPNGPCRPTTAIPCCLAVSLVFVLSLGSAAEEKTDLEILSGPEVRTPADAPLARLLELSTNLPTRVSVRASDGSETWTRDFYAFREAHALPLVGFKAGRTYQVRLSVHDLAGHSLEVPEPLTVSTEPLPDGFPPIEILASRPDRMEPGLTLFVAEDRDGLPYTVILDSAGSVVWYSILGARDIRQLANANLFFLHQGDVFEMSLLGDVVRCWDSSLTGTPPEGSIPVDSRRFHHEAFPTGHGTILSLSREVRSVDAYPTSETDPDAPTATADVVDDEVVEFSSATGEIVHRWSLHEMLDPTRIGYGSLAVLKNLGFDWGHANSVIHDLRDDTLIVSIRHQDAIVKFSRTTGELRWILGPHENWAPAFHPYLLTPVGEPFEWQFHQHSPVVTPHGTLLVFDNGNYRACPFHDPPVDDAENYSRAVEYAIDEQAMTVTQAWEHGSNGDERLYARARSDADWLPSTGNVLITFATVSFVDGVPTNGDAVRIVEVDRSGEGETVFELSIQDSDPGSEGWTVYRSERIRDLYPPRLSAALQPDLPGPMQLAQVKPVTFTAAASGGSGSYEYQFWLRDPAGAWAMVQDYGSDETLLWLPDSAGSFRIRVWVRNQGGDAVLEAAAETHFDVVIDPPVTSVVLTADHPSPAELPLLEVVTFTAAASGGTGRYDYLFRLRDPRGNWAVAQDYGQGEAYAWTPACEGGWLIEVWARNVGSPALWEAVAAMPFEISPLFADDFESGDLSAWSIISPRSDRSRQQPVLAQDLDEPGAELAAGFDRPAGLFVLPLPEQ